MIRAAGKVCSTTSRVGSWPHAVLFANIEMFSVSASNLNHPWDHAAILTCFKRVGGEGTTQLLAAGALHPQLVLRPWTEVSLGDGVNAVPERVPLASVLALTVTRVDTHSGTHTHFDPVDNAKLRALEKQACGICAD